MTAAALLSALRARGVIVERRGDRLRVRPARAVSDDEVQALRRLKPEVLALLFASSPWPPDLAGHPRRIGPFTPCAACGAGTWVSCAGVPVCLACAKGRGSTVVVYRDALRAVWKLMAAGADADPGECGRALAGVDRLIAKVGEPLATPLRHRWERDWREETGRCPRCGEPVELHGGESE